MCGIAGWVGAKSPIAEEGVRAMNGAQARRGPDAEGLDVWSGAVLGHRRLSIFDLSAAGKQPMMTPDRKLAVVFNGAIYNFRDLRAELEAKGCRFVSHTDTEILLHGYREWGISKLVEKIRGMFAIALWDDAKNKLYLIRDRLGVKPLYYTLRPDGSLAFASTARALRAAGLAGEIDPAALGEYLEFGYVTDAKVIYSGLQKLAAGHLLEWSDGAVNDRSYWEPPTADDSKPVTFEQAVDETERLFLEAVKVRLFADVPVGALLSGGVDSSLVCWAIKKLGGNLTAYTISTPGDAADESRDAVLTARALGIAHKILPIDPEQISVPDQLAAAYSEPFACSSALGMLELSQAIKPEATVLLTGDGGDDVFLGYPEHNHLWMAQRLSHWIPEPFGRAWYGLRNGAAKIGALKRPAHFLDYATGGLGAVAAAHDGWPNYQRDGMLGDRLRDVKLWQRDMKWSPDAGRRVLADMLRYDRSGRFTGEYMTKVDGGAMYYALEARSPFLDQSIWEYAGSLPYSLRLHGGQLKAVLRELAHRHLGDRVAFGRKRGFTIPAQRWLAGRWLPQAKNVFQDSLLERGGWINSSAVLKQLDAAAQKQWAPLQLWYLFVLENWMRFEKADQAAIPATSTVERSVVYSLGLTSILFAFEEIRVNPLD